MTSKPYRPNVGIALFNAHGRVLIGHRFKHDGPEYILPGFEWQMPQGGIDPGEEPYQAALRELHEETGVSSASLIAEAPEWFTYEIPPEILHRSWRARYRGQRQKWFAIRFTGKDNEINVASPGGGHKAEFVSWRWEPMKNLPQLIIPFKRPVYERVVKEFSSLAGH
jgi:putative (di)nucleoside polyphosphate hydrolase